MFTAVVFAGACATNDSLELSETDQYVQASNRIALNRIALNRIALNRIAFNGLASVTSGPGSLLDTADGRDLIAYATQCALPAGQDLALTADNGTTYHFGGALGLAPNWYSAPASDTDKRWVSACLLARCNAYGVPVALSLRGNNPVLTVDADEAAAFGLREAAFWGNLFSDSMEAKACAGPLKLAGSQQSTLPLRDCSTLDSNGLTKCGMDYAGACQTTCTDANGLYTSCAGTNEVMTVYLAN